MRLVKDPCLNLGRQKSGSSQSNVIGFSAKTIQDPVYGVGRWD